MSTAAVLPADAGVAPARGKTRLVVIVVAVLLLLAAAGGGAWYFFHQKASDAGDGAGTAKHAEKVNAGKPPVFMPLENFTVNLAGGDHFMQLGLVLQLRDEETAAKVKTFLPLIRNRILLLLSSKAPEDLQTPKGKQALVAELLADAREPLHADGEQVQAVLLGSMLIQ